MVSDGEGGEIGVQQFISSEKASQLKLAGVKPVTLMQDTDRTQFVNKSTGQPINAEYAFAGGDIWSGTFAGKDSTAFAVKFDPQGNPYFYTTQGRGSKDKRFIAPITLGLMFIPGMQGVGASLGAAIAPTVAVGTQALIGNAIVQGVLAEAQGGEFIKGAALSAAGSLLPGVSAPISNALGGGAAADVIARGLTTGAFSELTGGDFIDGALAGALAAGGGKLAGETLGLEGITASAVGTSLVNGVVANLQGKDVNDALIAGAISGALSYKDTTKPFDATEREGSLAKSVTEDGSELTTDYSLFGGATFPKLEGIKTEPITNAGANVGESAVDYSLGNANLANMTDGFGLKTSTSPNLDNMGGGQGLLSSASTTDNTVDATEREGSLAKPTTTDGTSSSNIARTVAGVAGAAGAVAAVSSLGSPSTIAIPRLQYGDIYKDAPLKGFSMRKDETTGRYTPFIGETALLAKGGFVSKRKSEKTGKSTSFVTRQT
jgi:hypothetical protein